MIFPGGIAFTADKLASVFIEQPLTLARLSAASEGVAPTISPDVESHLYLEGHSVQKVYNSTIDCTNQFSDFLCRPSERMDHATITTNGLTPILSKTLVAQDFDKIRMGRP
jgi:hypothetical protein